MGLALACFGMAAVPGALALGAVFFGLRLFGQGLTSHAAMTSMSRYFVQRRGTAMSVASLGFAVGEGLLPLLVVGALALLSWREVWLACGAAVLLLQLPLAQLLLVGHGERHARFLEATRGDAAAAREGEAGGAGGVRPRQWTQAQVVRDPCFYLLLPAVLANAFVLTGVFFHQVHLVEQKGWPLSLLAASFPLFAAVKIGAALLSGPFVDRVGAVRLLPGFLAPLGLGLLTLALVDHPVALLALMAGAGLTMGAGANIVGAMWAEVYGTLHLGAIRSMAAAVMVFSTSLSPVTLGALFDRGVSVEGAVGLLLGYVVASAALVTLAARRLAGRAQPQ